MIEIIEAMPPAYRYYRCEQCRLLMRFLSKDVQQEVRTDKFGEHLRRFITCPSCKREKCLGIKPLDGATP